MRDSLRRCHVWAQEIGAALVYILVTSVPYSHSFGVFILPLTFRLARQFMMSHLIRHFQYASSHMSPRSIIPLLCQLLSHNRTIRRCGLLCWLLFMHCAPSRPPPRTWQRVKLNSEDPTETVGARCIPLIICYYRCQPSTEGLPMPYL